MVDIKGICHQLENELSNCSNKDDVLLDCVSTKLCSLYMTQSEELDNILSDLSSNIEGTNMKNMYKIIRRLNKNLSNNRTQLIKLIEEVNS